ncbi:MAG: hypothetical protein WDZ37_07475 [Solirubrobacterales bacterium]
MAGTAPSKPDVEPAPESEPSPDAVDHTGQGLVGAARNRMVNELVFLQGVTATKQTLREWSRRPWQVMRVWLFWSVVIALLLLTAVLVVAHFSTPDPTGVIVPGFNSKVDGQDIGMILFRNSLVLALHAFACIAGFIAGNSLPISAAKRSGFSRMVHEKAGPLSIGFVACATTFSLATQAYFLGNILTTLAAQVGLSDFHLLLLLIPHALPELTALFLPLAAWLIASRRDDWDQLLAATLVTVAVAVPVLIVSAILEVTLFPDLLRHATGS